MEVSSDLVGIASLIKRGYSIYFRPGPGGDWESAEIELKYAMPGGGFYGTDRTFKIDKFHTQVSNALKEMETEIAGDIA